MASTPAWMRASKRAIVWLAIVAMTGCGPGSVEGPPGGQGGGSAGTVARPAPPAPIRYEVVDVQRATETTLEDVSPLWQVPAWAGFELELREAEVSAGAAADPGARPPVAVTPLDDDARDALFARLPAIQTEADDVTGFAMRAASLAPPRAGADVRTPFPPDDTLPPPDGAVVTDDGPLEVLRYRPDGAIGLAPDVSITFSAPMVALTSLGELDGASVPATLTPMPPGTWSWLDTRTLQFEPTSRMPMATNYRVEIPKGTRSANDNVLGKAVSFEFATPPAGLIQYGPTGSSQPLEPTMWLGFDQDIDAAAVLDKLEVTAGGKKIDIVAGDHVGLANTYSLDADRVVAFKAAKPLPRASRIDVVVPKGTPSAEGPRLTEAPQQFSFYTYGPFEAVQAYCYSTTADGRCYPGPGTGFSVELTNATAHDQAEITELVTVTPAIENQYIETWGRQIQISGVLAPETRYTIELSKALTDQFGQKLEGKRTFTLETAEAGRWPRLNPSGSGMVVLDPHGAPGLRFASVDMEKARLRIYKVGVGDWVTYRDEFVNVFFDWEETVRTRAKMPGELVEERELALTGKAGEPVETRIDLTGVFGGAPGHAVVIIESLDEAARNDPYSTRASIWVQKTELGLTTYADSEQALAWVNALRDGAPVEGAQVGLRSTSAWSKTSATGTTGADGVATLAAEPGAEALIVASLGEDTAFMTPDQWISWSSQYDQAAWFVFDDRHLYQPGETVRVKGWVRQIKAGALGDVGMLPASVEQLDYVVYDPQYQELTKGKTTLTSQGGFDLEFALPDNANLGWGYVQLSMENAPGELSSTSTTHYFEVQEFRRPEFEVSMQVDPGPWTYASTATAQVSASYYAGGALPDAPTRWWATASPGSFVPPNRDDFRFGQQYPWWYRYDHYGSYPYGYQEPVYAELQSTTDADGVQGVEIGLGTSKLPVPVVVALEASVTDVNRQQWTSSGSLLAHPADVYIGMRTSRAFYEAGDEIAIDTITADIDGELVAGRAIEVSAVRMEWVFDEGRWQQKPFDPQKCTATSATDVVQCVFQAGEGGAWMFRAAVTDASGRLNESRMAVWVAGGDANPNAQATGDQVMLITDRQRYEPNTTAELLVIAPWTPAQGMLTIRRGDLVEHRGFEMTTASHTLSLELGDELTPGVEVQVDLVGSKPRTDDDGKPDDSLPSQPSWASGRATLPIETTERRLTVQPVPVDEVLDPGAETAVEVFVTDASGNPVSGAEVTLVVIDESVLALSGYQLADPLPAFYPTRWDAVRTGWLHNMLLLEQPELLATLATGGDAGFAYGASGGAMADDMMMESEQRAPGRSRAKKSAEKAPASPAPAVTTAAPEREEAKESGADADAGGELATRSNFEALAVFEPEARTDAQGRVRVPVTMPDSLTRYRVMAVAAHDRRFGKGESTITARLLLMMRPSPPRFLNYGDQVEVPIVLQNLGDEPLTVDLAARASNLDFTGDTGVQVQVPANDRVEVRFPATTASAGTARMQFAAVSGSLEDAAEIELPVWTPATTEAFAVYGTIDDGAIQQPIEVPANVTPRFGGLEITTSSTALHALTDAVLYLYEYPFECNEQIASRALGIVSLRDVLAAFEAEGLPDADSLDAFFDRELEKLARRQNSDGGWSWWTQESVPFVSIHVAHALVRARLKGVSVRDDMHDRAMSYLGDIDGRIAAWERTLRFKLDERTRASLVAYALYVRAVHGDDVSVRGKQLFDDRGVDGMSFEALAWLSSALSMSGVPSTDSRLEAFVRQAHNRAEETAGAANFVVSYTDGEYVMLHSNRRSDAVILDALMRVAPDDDLVAKVVAGLLAHRRKGRWGNTQENVFVLVGLEHYFSKYENVTPDFVARVWLGEDYAGEQTFQGRTTERQNLDIPMAWLLEGERERDLVLQKEGDGRLYYRLGMRYAPDDLILEPLDRGFVVSRSYAPIDDPEDVFVDPNGTWHIKSGASVKVTVSMLTTSRRYHVALVDPLPAGLEPLNTALATTGSMQVNQALHDDDDPYNWRRWWWNHDNMRDERVEAFTDLLWEGDYTYEYVARATTPGTFIVPPPRAEEMYSPETFGRGATTRVIVE